MQRRKRDEEHHRMYASINWQASADQFARDSYPRLDTSTSKSIKQTLMGLDYKV